MAGTTGRGDRLSMTTPLSYQFSCTSPGEETVLIKFHSHDLEDTLNHFVNFLQATGFDQKMIYDSLIGVILDRKPLYPDQPHT